ncbi:anaerobic ribonucleoside-triphosphate reductase activating protein [Longirhabdus pacifica]|uniref:anaerobic ribonucleoside-triphosphate reductase activating protein n=1 Tax=Longirhabdus pacifica TaxID=2305227 RepID=UPI001008F05A
MHLGGYIAESVNEGTGLRTVLFISGCRHYCTNCFNTACWDFHYGQPFTDNLQEHIINNIAENPLIEGISLVGGDPFFSAGEVAAFIRKMKAQLPHIHIWIYSGFTYEAIIQDEGMLSLLCLCDVLVDGKFIEAEKDLSLPFRGSRNQRIIDIKQSLEKKSVITLSGVYV